MNKKASSMIIWGLIIGFVLFTLTALAFGNGVRNALSGYKASHQSLEMLKEAMLSTMDEATNFKLQLVPSQFDEDMAIYIFNKDAEGISEYYSTEDDPKWEDGNLYDLSNSASNSASNNAGLIRKVIKKPFECLNSEGLCICLCQEMAFDGPLTDAKTKTDFSEYYPSSNEGFTVYFYDLKCGKLECSEIKDLEFQEDTYLKRIVDDSNYNRIQEASDKYVFQWEGGFSIWRSEDEPYNLLLPMKIADLYVISNNDYTVGICLDPDCIRNK
ncbi:MAG: hypothetical protein ACP5N2_06765 [Candidatus Nanoarchaeia archaeon]